MAKYIRAMVKHPGLRPVTAQVPNTLQALQELVGGYIETVTLFGDMVVIVNEQGRLLGLPPCCEICGLELMGTVVFAGADGDEFADLPVGAADMRRLFPWLWAVR